MKVALLVTGLVLLIATEILKVYFVMPFPHSQMADSLDISYFIYMHIWWIRLAGLALVLYPLLPLFRSGGRWQKGVMMAALLLYVGVAYLCNFKFMADEIFDQPKEKVFTDAVDAMRHYGQPVIGVVYNGEAKAYPVSVIAFHHQVKDTVGGKPIIVTYCSFCRTGRVYSPYINGKYSAFRLVGMSSANSIFEDEITKSWWRQASGAAVEGELKDARLNEVPSEIMFMGQWLHKYPKSLVMKPDRNFLAEYNEFNTGKFKIF